MLLQLNLAVTFMFKTIPVTGKQNNCPFAFLVRVISELFDFLEDTIKLCINMFVISTSLDSTVLRFLASFTVNGNKPNEVHSTH